MKHRSKISICQPILVVHDATGEPAKQLTPRSNQQVTGKPSKQVTPRRQLPTESTHRFLAIAGANAWGDAWRSRTAEKLVDLQQQLDLQQVVRRQAQVRALVAIQ